MTADQHEAAVEGNKLCRQVFTGMIDGKVLLHVKDCNTHLHVYTSTHIRIYTVHILSCIHVHVQYMYMYVYHINNY